MEEPLELAERALAYADGDAQVTVVHERSLSSRFARSAPTQATSAGSSSMSFDLIATSASHRRMSMASSSSPR